MKERLIGGGHSLPSHINTPQCVFPLGVVTLRKIENKWQETSSYLDKEKEISLKRRKLRGIHKRILFKTGKSYTEHK